MEVNNEQDASLADALIQLDRAVQQPALYDLRTHLADVLNLTNPGWRDDEVVVNWVKEQGVPAAAEMLLRRHLR